MKTRALPILLSVLVLGLATPPAGAQTDRDRSETGRHKPVPPEPVAADRPKPALTPPGSVWYVGLAGGMQTGGDLWRVATRDEVAVAWRSLSPFTTERFTAGVDNNAALGLFVGRRLGDRWSLRLDLGVSRMDIAAEALQGQQGAVFLYDRFTFTTIGLAAEVKLARLPSYPYLSGGPILHLVSSTNWPDLDQTQIGLRLGLGYLQELSPDFSLRGEVRFSRAAFDAGDFIPQAAGTADPVLEFAPKSHLQLFEMILAVQMNL